MIFKRGKRYWIDDTVNGFRYGSPLKTKNWQEALRKEKEELRAIAEGEASKQGVMARETLDAAMDACLAYRKLHSAGRRHQCADFWASRTFATTGPMIALVAAKHQIGDTIKTQAADLIPVHVELSARLFAPLAPVLDVVLQRRQGHAAHESYEPDLHRRQRQT